MDTYNTQMLFGLYGSHIRRDRAIGFCKKHNAHLTEATLKGHKCLGKQCNYLKRHEENPFWAVREQNKFEKKNKRGII